MNSPAIDTPAAQLSTPGGRKPRRLAPGWFLVSPSVLLLLIWMIVPLGMTVYFSLIRYNLLYPGGFLQHFMIISFLCIIRSLPHVITL